jgi:hypothetical protein
MSTSFSTDFFAPIPALLVLDVALSVRKGSPLVVPQLVWSEQMRTYQLSQLDRADFFTYVIMGLAALIAIVVPLLNLH